MKKIIKKASFLLIVSMMIVFLIGCNQLSTTKNNLGSPQTMQLEKVCYLVSASNTDFSGETTIEPEYSDWNGVSFDSKTALKTLTISFDDNQYSGNYRNSLYENYNSFATDFYEGEDGLEFGINADTGELVYINLKTLTFFRTEPYLEDTEDALKKSSELAEHYASKFININEYELMEPAIKPYKPDGEDSESTMTFYTYTYAKYVNGSRTSNYLSVQITSKGNLASVIMGDVDAFTDVAPTDIDSFSAIDIENLVRIKADQILKKALSNAEFIDFRIANQYYAISPKGGLVLCVRAAGSIDEKTGGDLSSVGFEFVIK